MPFCISGKYNLRVMQVLLEGVPLKLHVYISQLSNMVVSSEFLISYSNLKVESLVNSSSKQYFRDVMSS